jgi:hypothetical protein
MTIVFLGTTVRTINTTFATPEEIFMTPALINLCHLKLKHRKHIISAYPRSSEDTALIELFSYYI